MRRPVLLACLLAAAAVYVRRLVPGSLWHAQLGRIPPGTARWVAGAAARQFVQWLAGLPRTLDAAPLHVYRNIP